jgi:hypothetical protein
MHVDRQPPAAGPRGAGAADRGLARGAGAADRGLAGGAGAADRGLAGGAGAADRGLAGGAHGSGEDSRTPSPPASTTSTAPATANHSVTSRRRATLPSWSPSAR